MIEAFLVDVSIEYQAPGSVSRKHVESLGKPRIGKPRDSTSVLEALPGKLDIKGHSSSIPDFSKNIIVS